MLLLTLLIGAHFCGDALTYSPKISGHKRGQILWLRVQNLVIHCLIHAFWVWVWLWSWDIRTKIKIAVFIFIMHFCIDFVRPYIETFLIPRKDFVIFEKKTDVLSWIKGEADKNVTMFLDVYFFRWLLINMLDLGLHLSSIAVCAWLFYSF